MSVARRRRGHRETKLTKKNAASSSDNGAKAKQMHQRILVPATEKTTTHLLDLNFVLMTFPARGSQGIEAHSHLVEQKFLRGMGDLLKAASDALNEPKTSERGGHVWGRKTNVLL